MKRTKARKRKHMLWRMVAIAIVMATVFASSSFAGQNKAGKAETPYLSRYAAQLFLQQARYEQLDIRRMQSHNLESPGLKVFVVLNHEDDCPSNDDIPSPVVYTTAWKQSLRSSQKARQDSVKQELDSSLNHDIELDISNLTNEKMNDIATVIYCESFQGLQDLEQQEVHEGIIYWTDSDADTIATLVYYEALGGCTLEHQELAAVVVVNRVRSDLFPNNVHDVVVAPKQYLAAYADPNSWYRTNAMKDEENWQHCREIAIRALNGEIDQPEDVLYQAEFVQGKGIYKICEPKKLSKGAIVSLI